MPYGLPCPDDLNPDDVFTGAQQTTDYLGQFVTAVEQAIQSGYAEAVGLINGVTRQLTQRINAQIRQIDNILNEIVGLLQQQATADVFHTQVSLSQAISHIADSLQTTTEDVIYGTPTAPGEQALASQGQPLPELPPALPSGAEPAARIGVAPAQTAAGPAAAPGPPVTLFVGGSQVTAAPVCSAVALSAPVQVGGGLFTPTVQVFNSGAGVQLRSDGGPRLPVGYDLQPDGSVVVYAGPIHIRIAMPSADPSRPHDQCSLVPV